MIPRLPLAAFAAIGAACAGALGCSLIAGLSDYHHATGGGGSNGTGGTGGAGTTSSTGGSGGQPTGSPGVWPDSVSAACLDDTGQHFTPTCTDKTKQTYGQDGTFTIHEPTYTVSQGTVKDSITGLTWMGSVFDPVTLADAKTGCEGSVMNGLQWRLPTRLEILSLIDMGHYNLSLDPTVFVDLGWGASWTSSPGPGGSGWVVRFDVAAPFTAAPTEMYPYFCVNGPVFSGGITAVDMDTAFDSRTGLTWQRHSATLDYSWPDAVAYCELQNGQQKGDEKGWRLPTNKELLTIVAEETTPAIDTTLFPDTDLEHPYWTSSPNSDPGYEGRVYGVSFSDGTVDDYPSDNHYAVRCVKTTF